MAANSGRRSVLLLDNFCSIARRNTRYTSSPKAQNSQTQTWLLISERSPRKTRDRGMTNQKDQLEKLEKKCANGIVAVGIDKDKGSQHALKWATEHLLARGSTLVLIHVNVKATSHHASWSWSNNSGDKGSLPQTDPQGHTEEIFHPCHVFCARKGIQCKDVIVEDTDVARALIEYAFRSATEHLVLGASNKTGLLRKFKLVDIPGTVAKGAPDFCSVYVVAKEKIQTMKSASRPAPAVSLPGKHIQASIKTKLSEANMSLNNQAHEKRSTGAQGTIKDESESFRSPLTRKISNAKSDGENSLPGISNRGGSFISKVDRNYSFESLRYQKGSMDISSPRESFSSGGEGFLTSHATDDIEAEMRRLKLELKRTMEMYSTACKEALQAQQKTIDLQHWKREEERRLEEARLAEEAALAVAEKEMAKSKAAKEAAEAQKRIAELEAQQRVVAEMKALKESEEKTKALSALTNLDISYRRYSIEEIEAATEHFANSLKIGEGGYGPVYKCRLDHTLVAVKVLRPDATQGRSQFQREVEVLSCIRHPNMVLLLGACPEYGCLVYDYMANGSLEERLFRRGNTPSLSWQMRFKIAAEIGTGLLFLHQRKPEPLVHRDLKPANILLDGNYVAKISDVGLARLIPPSSADSVTTQYQMTSAAGTFCYIDPEYQQTGMLGVKSDVYSLGIIILQILTARPPMGLTHQVERAIEKKAFDQILDPTVPDWPVEEALSLATMALKCSQLRRRERPDLAKVVLPELIRLKNLA